MSNSANPFNDLEQWVEQMQESVENAARWWETEPSSSALSGFGSVSVDLEDTGESFVLTADLPGFEKDHIDVRVTDQTLRVRAEHDESAETEDATYVRRERRHRSVARSVRLPEPVETADLSASYTNGVLTVRLPKRDPGSQGTHVEIQ